MPRQARWQLDLDAMGRGKVGRVVGMKSEPYPLVGDVVAGEPFLEQLTRRIDQRRIQTSHDDPPQWPGLFSPKGGSVRFDDQAAVGIEPEGKAVAPETVHRDGDVHVLQESPQMGRVVGIVQP